MGIFETEDQFRTRSSSVPLITGAMKQSTLVGRSSCTVSQQRNIVRIEDQYRFLYADDIVPNTCFAPLSRTTWVPKEPRMAPPDATLLQRNSDTTSLQDGRAPEPRLPPADQASMTELSSQKVPKQSTSSQENVAPPGLR